VEVSVLVRAKPETTQGVDGAGRPAVWHELAERLLAEGWLYDTVEGEWVLGELHSVLGGVGHSDEERGRIAWQADGSAAWLQHPAEAPTEEQLRARTPTLGARSHLTLGLGHDHLLDVSVGPALVAEVTGGGDAETAHAQVCELTPPHSYRDCPDR
jgi:hypothetical protein